MHVHSVHPLQRRGQALANGGKTAGRWRSDLGRRVPLCTASSRNVPRRPPYPRRGRRWYVPSPPRPSSLSLSTPSFLSLSPPFLCHPKTPVRPHGSGGVGQLSRPDWAATVSSPVRHSESGRLRTANRCEAAGCPSPDHARTTPSRPTRHSWLRPRWWRRRPRPGAVGRSRALEISTSSCGWRRRPPHQPSRALSSPHLLCRHPRQGLGLLCC